MPVSMTSRMSSPLSLAAWRNPVTSPLRQPVGRKRWSWNGQKTRQHCPTPLVVALAMPFILGAQQPADTTKPAPPPSQPETAPPTVSIPLDFSGVLYANFQYRGDRGAAHSTN